MSRWQLIKLGDCCEIVSGATPKTGIKDYWGGAIPWATPKDLSNLGSILIDDTPRKITEVGLRSCAASVLPTGSVLLSSRAPIGYVAINTVPMATNQGFKSLVPRSNMLDAKYLLYWLRANRTYLEGLGNGATFKEVSKATVSAVEIPLPPLAEQRRIADVLNRADELRTKRRKAVAHLDDLSQSIFLDMFADPAVNPHGWETTTIEAVAEQVTDGEHLTPKRASEGIKLLSARNVKDGYLDFTILDYVPREEYQRIRRRCEPVCGDILVSCSGTIGRVAAVKTDEPLSLVRSVALIRPSRSVVTTDFLEGYLRTPALKARMVREANASSQANLFQGPIRRLPVFLPPLGLQEEFGSRIAAVNKFESMHRASLAELDALFASLQDRAFKGLI